MAKNSPQDLENRLFFSSRLNELMDTQKVRQIDLHIKLGIPKSTLTGYVKGRSLPTPGNVQKLADFFGVKKSDLDSRFSSSTPPIRETTPQSNPTTAILSQLTAKRQESVLNYATKQLEEQIQEKQESYIDEQQELYTVNTVSELAAGLGFGYDDNDIRTVTVANEPPRHDIASLVNGDSMLPDYEDGDVVYLVDVGFSRYSGQVCAVVVDDETFIKRVYTEPNGLRLVSLNPAYPDKFIDFPPLGDTHIKIFKVIGSDTVVSG